MSATHPAVQTFSWLTVGSVGLLVWNDTAARAVVARDAPGARVLLRTLETCATKRAVPGVFNELTVSKRGRVVATTIDSAVDQAITQAALPRPHEMGLTYGHGGAVTSLRQALGD